MRPLPTTPRPALRAFVELRFPLPLRIGLGAATCAALLLAARPAAAVDNVFLQVDTPAITLTPDAADYARDYVEVTGSSGIKLRVKTNSATGMAVFVRASGGAQIAPPDLLVRTLTAPGPGGRTLGSFTPLLFANQTLWSTGQSGAPFYDVWTDVRVQNLFAYDDAPATGSTSYQTVLEFSVVTQ